MHFTQGEIYHLYNRGNDRQRIFFDDADYLLFLSKLREQIYPYCSILFWCLVPEQFHLCIQATEATCATRKSFGGEKPMQILPYRLGILLSSYAQQSNRKYGRTGSLFRQKTKCRSLAEEMDASSFKGTKTEYLTTLMHGHHQKPYIAGLVKHLEDWRYSSFRDYANLRNGSLCDKGLLMELTGLTQASFHTESYLALQSKSDT